MKVTLREKKLNAGKCSLYLDYYPPILKPETGKPTRREFLSLYLHDRPKTDLERSHNRETRILAENVRARRQLEIQAGNYGFLAKSKKTADFLLCFQQQAATHNSSKSAARTWINALIHFTDFCGGTCTFERVGKKFVEEFRDYLLTCHSRVSKKRTLSPNTASAYFQCFTAVIAQAVKDKILIENPTVDVKAIKTVEANREYLTLEELHLLAKTPCRMPEDLRRAALLSALTGLRFSDIQNLKWENVRHSKGMNDYLEFKIKKTGESLTLPMSSEARDLLNEAGKPSESVFENLDYGSMISVFIGRWAIAAGITKPITFHSFRHTFATAQLTAGTDLYTVSKLLGHKSIAKTQIYARIIDQKKIEAANKITLK